MDPSQVTAMGSAIADHVGADGAGGLMEKLGGASGIMTTVSGLLDRDGDGNPINDIMGMAKGLFGGSKT